MNDKFDEWLRDNVPKIPEDGLSRQIHRAILGERIREMQSRRRKRNRRLATYAASVAFLLVFVGNVVELGGDGFEMAEVENSSAPGRVLRNVFRGGGFNVLDSESDDDALEIGQQLDAGEGVIVEVEGWEIGGVAHWLITRVFIDDGTQILRSTDAIDPPSIPSLELLNFMTEKWEGIKEMIESGSVLPHGVKTVTLDGTRCNVRYWEIASEEFGSVIYLQGQPTR